jgi:hypothetical protein
VTTLVAVKEQVTLPPPRPLVAVKEYDCVAKLATTDVVDAPSITVVGEEDDGAQALPVQVQEVKA